MNGNNHPVEDSWDVSITSPRPHLETQALLLLLLLYVSLWSVSMGVVIAVANIEVQDPPPVLYLCCFTKFSFRQYSAHFLSFKTGFFFQTFPLYGEKEKEASCVEDQQCESSTMATPEGQRRQRRFAVTSNNTLLLLEGISLWVNSYFLMQSGPHIYIKN